MWCALREKRKKKRKKERKKENIERECWVPRAPSRCQIPILFFFGQVSNTYSLWEIVAEKLCLLSHKRLGLYGVTIIESLPYFFLKNFLELESHQLGMDLVGVV